MLLYGVSTSLKQPFPKKKNLTEKTFLKGVMHSFKGCYVYKLCIDKCMIERIVLTLTKHPLWGYTLLPVLVEENEYGKMEILEYADSNTPGFSELNELSKEIVLLSEKISDGYLMGLYSKEKTIAAFQKKVKPETIEASIRPYIENIQYQMLLLLKESKLPFFIRENVKMRNLYESNLAVVPQDFSKVVFRFTKGNKAETINGEETILDEDPCIRYSLRVKWEDEEMDLYAQPFFQLCSEPAALVINKKLLLFDNVDLKRLTPFFTKKEVKIPLSYEATYIKTYIKNCLESHEVLTEGLDIADIIPQKEARLFMATDDENMPIMKIVVRYEGLEYDLESTSGKIVKVVENEGNTALRYFQPDKEWEKNLMDLLVENGLEKTGISHFSLKKNKKEFLVAKQIKNMIDWIDKHAAVMNHFEFNQEMPA